MHYLATALIAAIGWSIPPLIDRFNLRYVNSISILAFRALIIGIIGIVTLFIITKKCFSICFFHNHSFNFRNSHMTF